MEKKVEPLMIVAMVSLGLLAFFMINRLSTIASAPSLAPSNAFSDDVGEVPPTTYDIYVDVKGAVKRPGVYKMPADTRVFQVIREAGGLLEDADTSRINLSQVVFDQTSLLVPFIHEENQDDEDDETEDNTMISLSVATHDDLVSLPNIGPATANAIIEYRETHGPFTSIEAIMNVSGIGPSTFENIAPYIVP